MNFVIDGTKWDFFRAKDDCTVALLSLSWLTFSWLLMLYFVWVKEKSYLCTDKMVASEDQIVSIIKERMIQIPGWHWQKMKIIPVSACIEPSMFCHCSWSDRKYPSCNQTISRDRYWHNDLRSLLKRTKTEWSTWPIVYRYTCSSPIICLFLFIAKVFYFLLFCFYNILTIGKLSDTLALFIS